jgi:membrane protease YdiL (CAAX protease family)
MQVSGIFDNLWVSVFPFFAEPHGFSFGAALETPEARSQLVGSWGILGLFLLSALFNTFLGEELLFRGILLPRMAGVFGKWDWVMNGLLGTVHW